MLISIFTYTITAFFNRRKYLIAIFFFAIVLFGLNPVSNGLAQDAIPTPDLSTVPTMVSDDNNALVVNGYRLNSQDFIIVCLNTAGVCTIENGEVVAASLESVGDYPQVTQALVKRGWRHILNLEEGQNLISVVAGKGEEYSNVINYLLYYSANEMNTSDAVPAALENCLSQSNDQNINPNAYNLQNEQANTVYSDQPGASEDQSSLFVYNPGERSYIGEVFSLDDNTFYNFIPYNDFLSSVPAETSTVDEVSEGVAGDMATNYETGEYGTSDLTQNQMINSRMLSGNDGLYCMYSYEVSVPEDYVDPDVHTGSGVDGGYDDDGNYNTGSGIDLDGDGVIDLDFVDVGYEYVGEECEEGGIGNCPCSDDSDCAGGNICEYGVCVGPECQDDSDCPGEICIRNRCMECTETLPCESGLLCQLDFGQCVECLSDANCLAICTDSDCICNEVYECEEVECRTDSDCANISGYSKKCTRNQCDYYYQPPPMPPSPSMKVDSSCPHYYIEIDQNEYYISSGLDNFTNKWAENKDLLKIQPDFRDSILEQKKVGIKIFEEEDELAFINDVSLKAVVYPKTVDIYPTTNADLVLTGNEKVLTQIDKYAFTYPWKSLYYLEQTKGFMDEALEAYADQNSLYKIYTFATFYLINNIKNKEAIVFDLSEIEKDDYLNILIDADRNNELETTEYSMVSGFISKEDVDRYYEVVSANEQAGRLMTEMTFDYVNLVPEVWDSKKEEWFSYPAHGLRITDQLSIIRIPNTGDTTKLRLVTRPGGYIVNSAKILEEDLNNIYYKFSYPVQDIKISGKDINADSLINDLIEYDEKRVAIDTGEHVTLYFDLEELEGEIEKIEEITGAEHEVDFFVETGGYYEVFRSK